ncbi:TPA: hypothetical protein N0F65_006034 [Lagenidium giganteum]|uniref:Ysc84 actin-binding domain-containing protein n=1 Tax=Lagenidium giganteum TaxID=4803 RepID=A0AAV2Z3H2_9STRA|nr:TPA: hypothetical protein N0F65_006034 [Lagenidium giganteum]
MEPSTTTTATATAASTRASSAATPAPSLHRANTADAGVFFHAALPPDERSFASQHSMSAVLGQHSMHASVRGRSNSWSMSHAPPTVYPGSDHTIDAKAEAKLRKEMANAVKVVETFFSPKLLKDQSIPLELLFEANGLVFLTVYKVGFLFSGKVGNGFVIARTTAGWSAPSFLSSGGVGFGMMAGGEMVNYMIILNSRSAVKVFTRNGQFQLGSELDLAVGPIGRAASAALNVGRAGFAPNYSYSHSVGLYGGIGLTSAVICTRKSINAKCYGSNVTARQILGGEVPCELAVPLWQALDKALGLERQYVKGFPVLTPATNGLVCDACNFQNHPERHHCERCQGLLVYSVGVHSGKRSASRLVMSRELSSEA